MQVWLGHHSAAFTLATYVHLLPDDLPDPAFLDGTGKKAVGPTAKSLTIKLKLSKKARRALKKARSIRLVVVIVGTDALGNARTVRRTVVIRR